MDNAVEHPKYYCVGKIEVIDFIEDKQLNYHRGNAVKYICRAGLKDKLKEAQDLQKAVWYINREIERLNSIKDNTTSTERKPLPQEVQDFVDSIS